MFLIVILKNYKNKLPSFLKERSKELLTFVKRRRFLKGVNKNMEILLKLTGGLFICISSALIGIYYSYRDSYRISDLAEMKKALTVLLSEIDYALNPLPEAFRGIAGRTNGEISSFFKNTAERLEQRTGEPLSGIWEEQIAASFKTAHFVQEDLAAFSQLGKTLGYLDKSLQLKSVDMALLYIGETHTELVARCEKNKKLYRSLGILGGLLITLIIL